MKSTHLLCPARRRSARTVVDPRSKRRLAVRRASLAVELLEERRLLSVQPFPVPLEAIDPPGSLVYQSLAREEISATDRLDHFTVDLDDGQSVTAVVDPPEGVEVSVREGEGRKLLFVINHTEEPKTVSVPAGKEILLGGGSTGEKLEIEAYGVEVILL